MNKLLSNVLEGDIANGISTHAFLKFVRKITKKDIRHWVNQWIFQSGYPKIECSHSFNRKKYVIELRITQEVPYRYFVGPLLVRIREPEGSFEHVLNLESLDHVFELPYHSRGKRRKPKRPKATNELADHSDLAFENIEGDSFVFWVVIDPNQEWIADVTVHQADQMYAKMATEDKCVIAQSLAIESLKMMSSPMATNIFYRVLLDSRVFYKVRMQAAQALASMEDPDQATSGLTRLLEFFQKRYAITSPETSQPIIRPNNFGDVSEYFVLKVMLNM